MMRALAGFSAAAVALIALPTTMGVVAEAESDTAVVFAATPATSGIAGFLEEPAILGLNMGAFLWVSVAVLAVIFAALAVGHSRAHGPQVTVAPSLLSIASTSGAIGSSQPRPAGFAAVADNSRLGR